jgi:hypothetical protein
MRELVERNLFMKDAFNLVKPAIVPPLDEDFRPAVLANRAYLAEVAKSGAGVPLLIGLERCDCYISHYQTEVFPDAHPRAEANLRYVERIIKFLIWQKGGWKIYVGGPRSIGEYVRECYSPDGICQFDYHFMAQDVYEEEFTVVICGVDEVPPELESGEPLGRHLDGCRIGFDLGASDRKSSAVIDGRAVFSEEVIWDPKVQSDPDYHYQEIMRSLLVAAAKMPRLDAIGGSAAGIYIDNQVRIASLFRGIPTERYGEVRRLFLRIREEM